MRILDEVRDRLIRDAAFAHVRNLSQRSDHFTSADLQKGFQFEGERIPLRNPQRGIFKPQRMRYLLSITTIFPRAGARVWYDDQRHAHSKLYASTDFVDYAFMGSNPQAADNRWLREAFEQRIPILYFIGVSPGLFMAEKAYIAGWNGDRLVASVGFGNPLEFVDGRFADNAPAQRYAMRTTQQRLHQASFRQAVMTAYDGRCALSGLPETMLLDAAHIVADSHVDFGQPIVPNGLPLSKIHHAAFDAHLIGIDADTRIHVSPRLLEQRDGPMLEAIKSLNGNLIRQPSRPKDRPDRDRLAMRFDQYRLRL